MANIESYRSIYLNFITNFLHLSSHNVWTIACSQHVYAVWGAFYDNPLQQVSGLTVRKVIEKFVLEPAERIALVDMGPWPANSGCAK